MIADRPLIVDPRDAQAVFTQLVRRRWGYVPEWLAAEEDAGTALAQVFARYLEAVLRRLNQAPDKNKLAFLDLLGLATVPAQAARAPVVFTLAAGAADITAPAGAQLSATAPEDGSAPLVFETETASAIMSAALVRAVSLWPGRDQYVDHSAQLTASETFTLFDPVKLANVPHAIYIAHDVLLALSGQSILEVQFDLSQPGRSSLTLNWEYWDGDIWRRFKDTRPACASSGTPLADSTGGLMKSGRYLLETECAETAKREVNGSNKFWIRGTLDEPLVPATGSDSQILPEVEAIRLASIVNRPAELAAEVQVDYGAGFPLFGFGFFLPLTRIRVVNEAGERIGGVMVAASYQTSGQQVAITTVANQDAFLLPGPDQITLSLTYQGMTIDQLSNIQLAAQTAILVTLRVKSLALDQAFADATSLDLTKPFFPFGQQPGPGSTFYFSSQEVFSKPGAKFRLYFARTRSAQDSIQVSSTVVSTDYSPLQPTVAWEYWNGREWNSLLVTQNVTLNTSGAVDFTVPPDLEIVKVNDTEALWMRARVVRDTFGFAQTVKWNAGNGDNQFTYVVVQPPVLASIGVGYSWRYGPMFPEQVLTSNFFQYADRTYETRWPGSSFAPFERVPDTTPALYLGFDKKMPVDSIGVFFDLVEDDDSSERPPLVWEYWSGAEWRTFSATDETRNLGLPGILHFMGAVDAQSSGLFGETRFWIRGRLKEDEPPPSPIIRRIYTNSVWTTERRTLINVPLGASSGIGNQRFLFTQTPVLEGEQVEVREIAGARANVEWRILARELDGGATRLMRTLEKLLTQEGPATDVQSGSLRLTRDRERKVTEAWVRWESRPFLYLSAAGDRHYLVDRARGILQFGDGSTGKIPPAGALVRAVQMRAGGGSRGNVPAGAIAQLLGPLAGVQSVTNPLPAEGGADRESIEQYRDRAPKSLRHRNRAITAQDYETLALEASPAVAFVRAVPNRNDGGRTTTGWVTLIVIPRGTGPRPYPSFGMREQVEQYLMRRMPADVAALSRVHVTGPTYFPVGVAATVAPLDPSEAGLVEQRVRTAIANFLHPLLGGPEGRGWELGRDVYLSDLAAVVERVPGVDYSEQLQLLLDGVPRGERVPVLAGRMVAAGKIEIKVIVAERQKALQLSAQGEAL